MGYYTNLITSGIGLTEARLRALKDAGLRHSSVFNPPTMTWHASWPESMSWSASSAWHS